MIKKIFISLMAFGIATAVFAQQPSGPFAGGQPGSKTIRIADTLTVQEKANRNTIILRSELDSMIRHYNLLNPVVTEPKESVKTNEASNDLYILGAVLLILFLLGLFMYSFYAYRKKFNLALAGLKRQLNYQDPETDTTLKTEAVNAGKDKGSKSRATPPVLEKKISELNDELHKLTKENEGLNRVLKEYNGIQ